MACSINDPCVNEGKCQQGKCICDHNFRRRGGRRVSDGTTERAMVVS